MSTCAHVPVFFCAGDEGPEPKATRVLHGALVMTNNVSTFCPALFCLLLYCTTEMKTKSMVQAQTSVVKGEMLQSAWPLTTSAYASVISVQAEQGIPPSDLQNNS